MAVVTAGRSRTLRLAADAVTAALGLNLWLMLVLVPGLFLGLITNNWHGHGRLFLVLAPVPLVVLALGIVRRSPMWLLLAYPATLLLPVGLDPRTVGENAQRPLVFVLVAASLVGFLLGAAYLTSGGGGVRAVGRTRRLGASLGNKNPARWRRRRRIYTGLGVLSMLFPAALLYQTGFAPSTRAFLAQMYPGDRQPTMLALLELGALLLWLAAFAIGFVGPLRHHRTGDKELVAELNALRAAARRPIPTLGFYVAVVCALALMGFLLYLRVTGAP
jgi:hypothetical protein